MNLPNISETTVQKFFVYRIRFSGFKSMSCTIIITSEYKSSMTEQQKKDGVFVTLDVCALVFIRSSHRSHREPPKPPKPPKRWKPKPKWRWKPKPKPWPKPLWKPPNIPKACALDAANGPDANGPITARNCYDAESNSCF